MPIATGPACVGAIACCSAPCPGCNCLGVTELTSLGAAGVPERDARLELGIAWAAVAALAWTTVANLGDCTTVANVGGLPAESSFATLGGGTAGIAPRDSLLTPVSSATPGRRTSA